MSYNVIPTPNFKNLFKRLLKKYPSLIHDMTLLIEELSENPETGIFLGHNVYKIRMAISSKGKGKSAGARVITYVVTEDKEVYLVYIYDKSQLDNITKQQIFELLRNAQLL